MKRGLLAKAQLCAEFYARLRCWGLALLAVLALAGSAGNAMAAEYIGADLSDVKPEEKVTAANPQPVQLLFEFRTKGAPNGRATKYLKQQVVDTVKASGLFSEVAEAPVAGGALLSVVIDNVVTPKDTDSATGKGVLTGATFFVAGSTIADHYTCTVDFLASPTAAKITRSANHTMFTQMGLINSPPANAVKIGSIKDALGVMTRQIVSNPLNAVAADPAAGFISAPAQAAQPTAPAAAPSDSAGQQAAALSPAPLATAPANAPAPTVTDKP